jgi:hypothetical protein
MKGRKPDKLPRSVVGTCKLFQASEAHHEMVDGNGSGGIGFLRLERRTSQGEQ